MFFLCFSLTYFNNQAKQQNKKYLQALFFSLPLRYEQRERDKKGYRRYVVL